MKSTAKGGVWFAEYQVCQEARPHRKSEERPQQGHEKCILKFEAAAAEGNRTDADGAYKVAVKKVDQAVAKGVLHKNAAAHKKSAMTLKLNRIG